MTRKLHRSVVALAAAFACLMLMSTPAGAVVVTATTEITSGNMRTQNGLYTFDFPLGGGGAGCGGTVDFEADLDSTSTTGTFAVVGFAKRIRFSVNTNHYVLVLSWVSTPAVGAITGSSATGAAIGSSLQVRIKSEIYPASNTSSSATDCQTTATLLCRYNNITLNFAGTYDDDIHSIGASDTMLLTSATSTTLNGLPCGPPFTAFFSTGNVTITGMNLHVLTPP